MGEISIYGTPTRWRGTLHRVLPLLTILMCSTYPQPRAVQQEGTTNSAATSSQLYLGAAVSGYLHKPELSMTMSALGTFCDIGSWELRQEDASSYVDSPCCNLIFKFECWPGRSGFDDLAGYYVGVDDRDVCRLRRFGTVDLWVAIRPVSPTTVRLHEKEEREIGEFS